MMSILSVADLKLFMAMGLASKIIYPAIGITGSLLSTFVITTYTKFKSLQTPTNTFLISLTVADLCMSLYLVVARFIGSIKDDMLFKVIYCFLFSLHGVALASTITTILVIALHRAAAIVYPVNFKIMFSFKRCCIIVTVVWLACIVVIGTICMYYTTSVESSKLRNLVTTSDIYPELIVLIFIQIYPYSCVILSCLVYGMIFCSLAKKRNSVHPNPNLNANQGSSNNQSTESNRNSKVSLTSAILVVFLICWLPLTLYLSIASEAYVKSPNGRLVYMITIMLLHINAIINVYVFAHFSSAFRAKMVMMLRCRHE